ncbi:VOC family protein [Virgibacillus sp. NKC19-3]|uniref:VOC family protein n=1 Tax=Virgibacillus saliphilus TaxID=2831674 RepID=UPI001C9AD4E4|nr:VOC family protein [Virgibacillus sp. NKC19-3]MBY7142958.1 VOC family protein [Virgibacillus sp. NKC19-3]
MNFYYEAIDHVQLAAPVGSEDEARGFFRNVLGFDEMEKPETLQGRGGVWFRSGTVHVHIGSDKSFTPAKKAHPAFQVKNLEIMKDHLAAKNVDFRVDDRLPGANRFYVTDPFGNRIEFLEWV